MRSIVPATAAIVLTASVAYAQHSGHQGHQAQPAQGKAVATAVAEIKGEGITGTATFSEMKHGTGSAVHVELSVSGLKPGQHGVHLHAVGKCEPPAFTAAGGHFDPGPAGNTVQFEKEQIQIDKNALLHELATFVVSSKLSQLRNAIRGTAT